MAYFQSSALAFILSFLLFRLCISIDTITPIQPIRDGETLISGGEIFALGFFSPSNSKNRYVGIWYHNIQDQTVVWVANRENPVNNSSTGVLSIRGSNLILIDDRDDTLLWSTNISTTANYSSATLMDSGNLVLKDGLGTILWQSFDYPTHTFLPQMKLGRDRRTGLERFLTSWKSPDDPALGEFSYGLDLRGMPQYFVKKGSEPIFRSGPWNGQRLSGVPSMNDSPRFRYHYVDNIHEIYMTYESRVISRMVLDDLGVIRRLTWTNSSRRWNVFYTVPKDQCDYYGTCGPSSICDATNVPESQCDCLRGFEPQSPGNWSMRDWSNGCARRRPLDCGQGDERFLRLTRVTLPDTFRAVVEPGLSLQECEQECLKNCSCGAYARANISDGGRGCVMWGPDLIDLKVYSDALQDIFIRVAASDLDQSPGTDPTPRGFSGMKKAVITLSTTIPVSAAIILCFYCWWRKSKEPKVKQTDDKFFHENDMERNEKGPELPLFDFSAIEVATNNFSEQNMLGRGGFGPVYKGKLQNGQEIAVKRLSRNSEQGLEEFRNEITLIAKLQHKNLVRLWGCCTTGEEKMLIYEYMQNKSLDSFIFDQTRRMMLDWRKRFAIIMGIARGMLYLHEDSRLRIIHRDLKVSNILLDEEMNPKISDFGMARIFGGNQTQASTNRVVGTYGYMSPEYAMDGLFSVKSDVFSFGVLLLEIITGKRNSYSNGHPSLNLIGHVWVLWKNGEVLELADPSMENSCSRSEVLRCFQVGLLCVQESPGDRPDMSSVVFMLGSETTTMPSPKQPAISLWHEKRFNHHPPSPTSGKDCTVCDLTFTGVEAR